MPRWASRIDLEISCIRVQRLNDISEDDAIAEGIELIECHCFKNYLDGKDYDPFPGHGYLEDPVASFSSLWDLTHGKGSWDANPWVWVIDFERV